MSYPQLIAILLATLIVWPLEGAAQSGAGRPRSAQEVDLAQQKSQIDISNAQKQLESLERNFAQRWADEREKLKEDRDRAWLLFTTYLAAIFTVAGLLWLGLIWWIRLQRQDIDKTIEQVPVLKSNIRNFIVGIDKNWPDLEASLESLRDHVALDDIRHQVVVEYIRELTLRLRRIDKSSGSHVFDCLEVYGKELVTTLHLMSGSRRYVRLAANVLTEEKELPEIVRNLLPQLTVVYNKLDAEMADLVNPVCVKFDIKIPELFVKSGASNSGLKAKV